MFSGNFEVTLNHLRILKLQLSTAELTRPKVFKTFSNTQQGDARRNKILCLQQQTIMAVDIRRISSRRRNANLMRFRWATGITDSMGAQHSLLSEQLPHSSPETFDVRQRVDTIVIWWAQVDHIASTEAISEVNRRPHTVPSGNLLHSELENHHAINGKIHYFYGHFQ